MKRSVLLAVACLLSSVLHSAAALAGCSIHNGTSWSFTVTSGNTSNQSVGAHTQTSIAPGKIIGKSKEGKTFSGMCKEGDKLEISDDHGVPVLTSK